MTDLQLLCRAVVENPDCDTTRLAYADAAEEAGDTVHAELIRLQLRPEPDQYKRRKHLSMRYRKRLNKEFMASGGYPESFPHCVRGFCEEVRIYGWRWCELGEVIAAEQPLKRVRILGWPNFCDSLQQQRTIREDWERRWHRIEFSWPPPLPQTLYGYPMHVEVVGVAGEEIPVGAMVWVDGNHRVRQVRQGEQATTVALRTVGTGDTIELHLLT